MEIDLSRGLRTIRRYWFIAVVAAVILGALAAGYGAIRPESYRVDASILVVPTEEHVGNPNTIIELATTDPVLRPALDNAGIDMPTEDFQRSHLNVTNVPGTSIVIIEVTYSDPEVATALVNNIVEGVRLRTYDTGLGLIQRNRDNLGFQLDDVSNKLATVNAQIEQLDSVERELDIEDQTRLQQLRDEKLALEQRQADLSSSIRSTDAQIARFVDPVVVNEVAIPPTRSDSPSPLILGIAGAIIGALLGLAIGLLFELRDKSIRDEKHLADVSDGTVIASFDSTNVAVNANRVGVLSSMIQGMARRSEASCIALVAAESDSAIETLMEEVAQELERAGSSVVNANNALVDVSPLTSITSNSVSVVFAKQGGTLQEAVETTISLVQALGVPPLGSVLVVD